ncbi:metabolite ABC transporter [Klebsiella oxytoca]|nr:metabolite ABC transporter [Klebsiella oxytoca]
MIARWFWREWRSPSLLIVWLALSLAVACVLALGSISDRMEKGLSQQSREFMAGDRTLRSSREVPGAWIDEARRLGLTVGEQLSFATMTFSDDTPQLADVKAVDDTYPLYGQLQTQPPGLKPHAGTVLLAPRLMALLNLKTGDTIDVGDATLRIAGEVIQEPDAGFNPFQMAPRLMMNTADVAKTGAVQPGSRVSWRYKYAGTPQQLADYEKWLLPKLGPEHRWIGMEQDDSALGKSLQRSQQFFAAVGAVNAAVSGRRGGGGDEPLLPQSLRSGGDPQNPRRRTGAAAQTDCRPVVDAAGAGGDCRRGDGRRAGTYSAGDA